MLIKSIDHKIKDENGLPIHVTVKVYGRGGSKSGELWMVHHGARRITPYEFKRIGWHFDLNLIFKMVYQDKLEMLIPQTNIFYKMIKPDKEWTGGKYYEPVPLGTSNPWWRKRR